MSEVSNPNLNVTRQDLADFYDKIFPYLGGRANAGFTPVGTIISVMGVNAPANYLKCDGTIYNISDYPELATYFGQQFNMINKFGGDGTTTFAVPNLQGEFLRGAGTNSHTGNGNGASVGTHQDATTLPWYRSNAATVDIMNSTTSNVSISISNQDSTKQTQAGTPQWSRANRDSTAPTGLTGDSFTSRPTNTSVLFCIATKNIYMNPSLDYSTDEKVVGSWIDGRPLYQKTIAVVTPTAITQGTEVTNQYPVSADIDTGWVTQCTNHGALQLTLTTAVVNNVTKVLGIKTFWSPTTKNLHVQNNFLAWNGLNFYATLNYLKTTD